VSKNNIGARKILMNILLCKLRAAAKQVDMLNNALTITMSMEMVKIAPNIPILW